MIAKTRCDVASTIEEALTHIEAWELLSNYSLDDNIYISPGYLIPVLLHYEHRHPYRVLFIYLAGSQHSERLIGVAAYSILSPSWKIPCRVLSTFTSPLGFPSHPLVDREYAEIAIKAIWDWIEQPQKRWDIVLINKIAKQSATWMAMAKEIHQRGRLQLTIGRFERPILKRDSSYADSIQQLSQKRRKEYRRLWRRLNDAGTVETVLHRDLNLSPDLARRFMELEAKSWKGSSGTALICREADSAFFTDAVNSLGQKNQLFFIELRLNGQAIAMTSNFVAGKTLFAFKVAYDPQYARFSPGLLNEFEGMRLFHDTDDLQIGESGSVQNSYIRHYWRGRADMFSAYVATPRLFSSVSMSYIRAGASIRQSGSAFVDGFRSCIKIPQISTRQGKNR